MSSIARASSSHLELLHLPVEIIIMIMEVFPDPRDVCELALACKTFFIILKGFGTETTICRKILMSSHDPSLYRLAEANYAAALLPTCRHETLRPPQMEKFCAKYLDRKNDPLRINQDEFTLKRAIYMEDFHNMVQIYAKRFADDYLKTWGVSETIFPNVQQYQVPATESECVRVMKALYLAELVSKLTPAHHWKRAYWGTSSASDYSFEMFWLHFTPWDSQGVFFVQEWIHDLMERKGKNLLDNDERLERRLDSPSVKMFLFQGLERVLAGDWKPVEDEQHWECIRHESWGRPRYWFQKKWWDDDLGEPPFWVSTLSGTDALERYEVQDDDEGEASAWYWWIAISDWEFRRNLHTEEECEYLDEIVDGSGGQCLTYGAFWDRKRVEAAVGMRIPSLNKMTKFGNALPIELEPYDES